eukprot:4583141-Prymnesium_polylepis.1
MESLSRRSLIRWSLRPEAVSGRGVSTAGAVSAAPMAPSFGEGEVDDAIDDDGADRELEQRGRRVQHEGVVAEHGEHDRRDRGDALLDGAQPAATRRAR